MMLSIVLEGVIIVLLSVSIRLAFVANQVRAEEYEFKREVKTRLRRHSDVIRELQDQQR